MATPGVTSSSLRADLRSLPAPVWVLLAGTFVNRFGSFVAPFLVLYMTRLGYPAAVAGSAIGLYGLGSVAAAPVGGFMADRIGRRNGIALSMFTSAACMLGLSQARNLATLAVLAAIAGLTSEAYRPSSSALIADLVPAEGRVSAYATYRLAINLGFAIGPAIAGLLAQQAFLFVFVGDAATSVLFGVVALVWLPRRQQHGDDEEGVPATRTIISDRAFLAFLAASVAVASLYFQSYSTFALHVHDSGLPTHLYGALISLNGVLILILELPIASITRRRRATHAIAVGFLLTGLGFAMNAVATTFLTLAATVVVWTVGEMVHSPVGATFVADRSPRGLRGAYQGAWGLSWGLGMVVGPGLGGWLYSRSPTSLWLGCGVVGAAAAAVMWRLDDRERMLDKPRR